MSTTRRIRRSALLGALVFALFSATTGVAFAASAPSLDHPSKADVARAVAMGRYYSSYGSPEPIAAPAGEAPSDGSPLIIIVLSGIVVAAVTFTVVHRHRVRARRSAPRVAL
jgi:hypothetical protein